MNWHLLPLLKDSFALNSRNQHNTCGGKLAQSPKMTHLSKLECLNAKMNQGSQEQVIKPAAAAGHFLLRFGMGSDFLADLPDALFKKIVRQFRRVVQVNPYLGSSVKSSSATLQQARQAFSLINKIRHYRHQIVFTRHQGQRCVQAGVLVGDTAIADGVGVEADHGGWRY